jgi:transcriptional regulator with XRE-family HTH domain
MTKQEEIRYLIHTLGVRPSWIAEKIGMKLQLLNYLLHESSTFDDDLYIQIKEAIESYQFELHLFEDEFAETFTLFNNEKLHLGLGERVRFFALKKYGTLKKLAEAMEITPQQLQQYISGKREPGTRVLIKMLRLGCDLNWLLGGKVSLESFKIYKIETELKKLQNTLTQITALVQKGDILHH